MKPTFDDKISKVKQILEKKYQDREELIIKQS